MCVLYYKPETFCFSLVNSLTGERERGREGGGGERERLRQKHEIRRRRQKVHNLCGF